jgi:hypothetical protein
MEDQVRLGCHQIKETRIHGRDMTPEQLVQIKAALGTVTPGPWEVGDRYRAAGVMPDMFGADRCTYCALLGDPFWVGRTDINGTRTNAHVHIAEPYSLHQIVVWYGDGRIGTVCGNYDYDEGGVTSTTDAAFIANSRTWVPELVAEVERLTVENDRLAGMVGHLLGMDDGDDLPGTPAEKREAGHVFLRQIFDEVGE